MKKYLFILVLTMGGSIPSFAESTSNSINVTYGSFSEIGNQYAMSKLKYKTFEEQKKFVCGTIKDKRALKDCDKYLDQVELERNEKPSIIERNEGQSDDFIEFMELYKKTKAP